METAIILGAGMTGLACSIASGFPCYEAQSWPGGICSSYYMPTGNSRREEQYRFERGGGHWLFGDDPVTLRFIRSLTPLRFYNRSSAVFFPDRELLVPYPIQYHLSYLDKDTACQALYEMSSSSCKTTSEEATLAAWLVQTFGKTLWDEFFGPFHNLYTAKLVDQIAPQDSFKSPLDYELAVRGALLKAPASGYNARFAYPVSGLDELARKMAELGNVKFNKKIVKVDVKSKEIHFSDGTGESYEYLISTLPLNQISYMASIKVASEADPYTSVLVLNIGASKGPRCFKQHWLYIPKSSSGFHRVGAYSNVDSNFLPMSCRQNHVSLYVEKAYEGGNKPSEKAIQEYSQKVVNELKSWGFIDTVETLDTVWSETAYTWSRPGSNWIVETLRALAQNDILQAGRYAQWRFQGVLTSIKEGFSVGGSFRKIQPTQS